MDKANLFCHIHFWTLKSLSPGTAADQDTGRHVYHEKRKDKHDLREAMEVCRTEWAEGRGVTWTPSNKKPDKLRETIREYEELMSSHKPVAIKWKTDRHCLILLENGILVTFVLCKHSGDIERVLIDRSLLTRLQTSMDNAVFFKTKILLTTTDDSHPVCVSVSGGRRSSAPSVPLTLRKTDSGRKMDKLTSQDLKLVHSDGGGQPVSGVERRLRVSEDLLLIWWREGPTANRGYNLLFFKYSVDSLKFCRGVELNFDPVEIQFSNQSSSVLQSLEKITDSTYQCCSYEYQDGKLTRSSSADTISSQAEVVTCEWNREGSKVLLGCESATLILHDCTVDKPDIRATILFSPVSLIRWHPGGVVVMVCGPRGELQCFDEALNPLTFQTLSQPPSPLLQIGALFVSPIQLHLGEWGSQVEGECCDNFIIVFKKGPVVLVRVDLGVLSKGQLGAVELVSEYVRTNQMDKAILVLSQQSWSSQANDCFICLTSIMDHLLTQPLTTETEEQMLECLALSQAGSEEAHFSYKSQITHLTRRMFHLLVRHRRVARAMEVAESVGARDLFMDVHFLAMEMKNKRLAEQAKRKAEKDDFITDVLQAAGLADASSHF